MHHYPANIEGIGADNGTEEIERRRKYLQGLHYLQGNVCIHVIADRHSVAGSIPHQSEIADGNRRQIARHGCVHRPIIGPRAVTLIRLAAKHSVGGGDIGLGDGDMERVRRLVARVVVGGEPGLGAGWFPRDDHSSRIEIPSIDVLPGIILRSVSRHPAISNLHRKERSPGDDNSRGNHQFVLFAFKRGVLSVHFHRGDGKPLQIQIETAKILKGAGGNFNRCADPRLQHVNVHIQDIMLDVVSAVAHVRKIRIADSRGSDFRRGEHRGVGRERRSHGGGLCR